MARRTESAIRKDIAAAKEERSRAIIANAPADDSRAAEDHPDVREIEARIVALRAELAGADGTGQQEG